MLHSQEYRTRYVEFLKIDFPCVPLPSGASLFTELTHLGKRLVELHTLGAEPRQAVPQFLGPKGPEVGRIAWADDTVWLDAPFVKKNQPAMCGSIGFRGVPERSWQFRIGAYQVCYKWLKDRQGDRLSIDDIRQYQVVVAAVSETIQVMQDVDEVVLRFGGWPDAFVH